MRDLYPLNTTDEGDIRVPLTFDRLRRHLEDVREGLAVARCRSMRLDIAKRHDHINDGDYRP